MASCPGNTSKATDQFQYVKIQPKVTDLRLNFNILKLVYYHPKAVHSRKDKSRKNHFEFTNYPLMGANPDNWYFMQSSI